MAAVLKTAGAQALVSSNLTRSANPKRPDPDTVMEMPRRRRSPVVIPALVLTLVVLAGILGAQVLGRGTGCMFAGDTCLRVLFIGNSYTSVNDLPATFAALVRSGGGAVETRMIAPGGAFLSDHAASPEVEAAIAGTPWTAVVLQEQSQVPAVPAALDGQMAPAAASLVAAIRAGGARPYLLETWAHRDGWPGQGMDRAAMQAAINAAYWEVAARNAAIVVPAAEAWNQALAAAPGVALWQVDGSHPTVAGTYLAACVLYATITGRSPEGLAETGGLPVADATMLRRLVSAP